MAFRPENKYYWDPKYTKSSSASEENEQFSRGLVDFLRNVWPSVYQRGSYVLDDYDEDNVIKSMKEPNKVNPNTGTTYAQQHKDYMLDVRPIIKSWNSQREAARRNPYETYQAYLREIDKLVKADKKRLSDMPYKRYDKKVPKKSTLQQRAEEIINSQQQRGGVLPYSKKNDVLTGRIGKSLGFNDEQSDFYNQTFKQSNENVQDNIFLKLLKDYFKDNYIRSSDQFKKELSSDADIDYRKNSENISHLSKKLGNVQGRDDLQLKKIFESLGQNKTDKETDLINNLVKFSNQQHYYDDLLEKGNEMSHNIDVALPYFRTHKLEKALNKHELEPGNPNAEAETKAYLDKVLGEEGFAKGLGNFKDWDANRKPMNEGLAQDPVAQLDPQILESQYTLQRMDPKFKASNYDKKKELQKKLMNEPIGKRTFEGSREGLGDFLSQLDPRAEREFRDEMDKISNHYLRMGSVNSPAHIRASERKALDLQQKYAANKQDVLRHKIKNEQELAQEQINNELNLLKDISGTENNEFNTILKSINNTNDLGSENWEQQQNLRNKDIEKNLDRLKTKYLNDADFANAYVGSKYNSYTPEYVESGFNNRLKDYADRFPRQGLHTKMNRNMLEKTNYNPNDLASNDYVNRTKNSIQKEPDYKPRSEEDMAQSNWDFGAIKNTRDAERSNQKTIFDQEHKTAMSKADATKAAAKYAGNFADLGSNYDRYKNYINDPQEYDRFVELLEKHTHHTFPMQPVLIQRPTLPNANPYPGYEAYYKSKYIMDDLNKKRIEKIVKEILGY